MRKWIILIVLCLTLIGCHAANVYQAKETAKPETLIGKEISEKQFLSLQNAASAMLEDKTDYLGPIEKDPLRVAEETAATVGELGLAVGLPIITLIAGGIGTALRTARKMKNKYEPQIAGVKADYDEVRTVAVEIIEGIKAAKNGGRISTVAGPRLAESLKTSTSTATKKAIKKLEAEV